MDSIRGAHRRRNSKWARIRLHTPRLARNNSAPENNFMMPVFEDIRTHGGMSVGCLFRETDFSISGQQTCIIQVKAGVDEKSDTRSQTTIYALLAGLEHAFLLNFSEGRVEKIKAANAQYMNDIARAVVALRGSGTMNANRRKLENIIQAEIRVTIAVQKKDAETTETVSLAYTLGRSEIHSRFYHNSAKETVREAFQEWLKQISHKPCLITWDTGGQKLAEEVIGMGTSATEYLKLQEHLPAWQQAQNINLPHSASLTAITQQIIDGQIAFTPGLAYEEAIMLAIMYNSMFDHDGAC
ncbi:hypothetical protein RhiirA5_427287 [Rhizophagus irregularis]|uniref:Uncharacterized protein n=1 Tax=Rhizophagus irregularis TaxID=588596 RepID=A0A2N0P2M7_9GLOM|nr:hypothetical protein RhiirA5_427287 [Rhizophagus irregularis]